MKGVSRQQILYEWTYRLGRKGKSQVMPDGSFIRYQRSIYSTYMKYEWAFYAKPGGTAEADSFCPSKYYDCNMLWQKFFL